MLNINLIYGPSYNTPEHRVNMTNMMLWWNRIKGEVDLVKVRNRSNILPKKNRSNKGKISLVIHIVTHIDPKDENNIYDTESLHISESLHKHQFLQHI